MAYSLDPASSQYLSATSSPVAEIPVTVSCWIYLPSHTNLSRSIFQIGGTTSNGCRAQISSGNRIQILQIGNAQGAVSQIDLTAATTQWISVCGVFASLSSRSLYVNGVLQGTDTTALTSMNPFTQMAIGARQSTTFGLFFSGFVADFGVWSVALNADEISSLAKGFACSKIRPQSLVFYAPLVRNLIDVRGGLAITNNNTATVSDHPRIYL